ncbi:hypothetical protein [Ensifer sp.]|uniref:hypothetical protein n=1 Tax=Ensifer sp. TaxID=1872086 RepID=UPI002E15A4FC
MAILAQVAAKSSPELTTGIQGALDFRRLWPRTTREYLDLKLQRSSYWLLRGDRAMPILRPFHRNHRRMQEGPSSGYSSYAYLRDREYAQSPTHFIRAFMLIQDDLKSIFEYVEPSEECLATFSYRIHELLMRTCMEIEANFKAILSENIYTPKFDKWHRPILNMHVYRTIDVTHHLSAFEVILPIWNGTPRVMCPFECWKSNQTPSWYRAYNESKHDRQEEFKKANLDHLISAVAGLLVVLSAQFGVEDFSSGHDGLTIGGHQYHDGEPAIGGFFRVKFPNDWSDNEIYAFDWEDIRDDPNRFSKFNYDAL